ncbi:XRE family transcriptional regulator [Macrococcoides bohemicum]|uniref:helix-turn-helix domain-containing protein n=1 Tax=Macrococcoides bohemicum TaxID=1903056 RepID=UPI00105A7455|nr:helix-turn-helix transcriptional regulator [Macrococcus bohemicus]TDL35722.1 XRE family transcriptional regulator [Macrococcus bohemicus]
MRNSVEIGQIIKQKRIAKKLTVTEFANRVGLNKSTISRYENGSRKIPMEDITKFANVLEVSPQELLLNEKPKVETVAAHMDDDLTEEEVLKVQAYIAGLKANRK